MNSFSAWLESVKQNCQFLPYAIQPQTVYQETLSVPEAAKELKTSEDTIRGWINSGELKASNVATGPRPRYLIPRDELNRFLKGRQPSPPPSRKGKRTR
ncbi:helix-turn-helix domain-containing protein [Botrimarina mediterranea]|uniref:Helix-turn-helix domain protein n=1 Tax=Botrimarina mediterranea TaxID=2528022 RepID=A0A518K5K8_9BACT|nr:helix-turn-helix domain-containing protein [Botrimarina mediterranea]QDV73057.1 Helix-turn-helix domain protein [Botrimarina mediterranea]